ncbi:hypothetical protein RZ532_03965 [Nitratireductor aquimarinus]|uniref:hypothetical protein n=1 Tax=Nitratireductor aquimarinus TaxID=889300 RepID=UPI0029358646|nr:hypothetical protein [Nitratireductor aquimarinus]MDV2965115.1 hypothetical protein [Nitratireductor aquimarinus]
MTTIYQPPAQRGYRVFTGMGAADAIAGSGEAATSIVVRNVDDQHEKGSLRLSHADDHGPEAPRQSGWDVLKNENQKPERLVFGREQQSSSLQAPWSELGRRLRFKPYRKD